jgi:hypothetical protein
LFSDRHLEKEKEILKDALKKAIRTIISQSYQQTAPSAGKVDPNWTRNVSLLDALWRAHLRKWNARETYPFDNWKAKEPFYAIGEEIRQKAFEGLLPIWARRPSSNLFESVPPEFWRNHDLEPGYCILPEVTDCWVKVTHPLLVGEVPHARTAIWTDFMTSREAVEALWPASSDVSS